MLLKKGLLLTVLLAMAPATFAATTYPLTIENCGVRQTFTQAP
ncbi:iron complex transport system substrate-binding protein, partial [Enterobacter cloacae]